MASPKTLVVLVKTNASTAAATASSRVRVPVMLVSMNSCRLWVATWGLCNVAVWNTVRSSLKQHLTRPRSVIEPT